MRSSKRPPQVAWQAWPAASATALPAVAASFLFVARIIGEGAIDGPALGRLGLLLIVGLLALSTLARRFNWPGQLASLLTALQLGAVVPLLVLHAALAERALRDPAEIVLVPALATLGGLVGVLGLVLALPLLLPAAPAHRAAGLFLPGSLPVWLLALVWRPEEPLMWAALAVTFALGALVWFASVLFNGWLVPLTAAAALLVVWLLALSLGAPAPPSSPAGAWLRLAQLLLATAASLVAVTWPSVLLWRQARRKCCQSAAVPATATSAPARRDPS